jgi:hypothetical protein
VHPKASDSPHSPPSTQTGLLPETRQSKMKQLHAYFQPSHSAPMPVPPSLWPVCAGGNLGSVDMVNHHTVAQMFTCLFQKAFALSKYPKLSCCRLKLNPKALARQQIPLTESPNGRLVR